MCLLVTLEYMGHRSIPFAHLDGYEGVDTALPDAVVSSAFSLILQLRNVSGDLYSDVTVQRAPGIRR